MESATTPAAVKSAATESAASVHGGEAVIALDAGLAAVMNPAECAVAAARILAFESLRTEALTAAALAAAALPSTGRARSAHFTRAPEYTRAFRAAVPIIQRPIRIGDA